MVRASARVLVVWGKVRIVELWRVSAMGEWGSSRTVDFPTAVGGWIDPRLPKRRALLPSFLPDNLRHHWSEAELKPFVFASLLAVVMRQRQ